MTPTREDKIGAAVVTAVTIAAVFGAGWGTSRATTPEPQTTTTSNASSGGYASTGPAWPVPTPTPEPSPIAPAVYGSWGLAAAVAKKEGHDSMSAACAAGIAWTCNITEIEQWSVMTQQWKVTIGDAPSDGDAIARELLDRAPSDVTRVDLSYIPHGQAARPQPVGSAERPLKR